MNVLCWFQFITVVVGGVTGVIVVVVVQTAVETALQMGDQAVLFDIVNLMLNRT